MVGDGVGDRVGGVGAAVGATVHSCLTHISQKASDWPQQVEHTLHGVSLQLDAVKAVGMAEGAGVGIGVGAGVGLVVGVL